MAEKRKVRTVVRDEGEFREFELLDDAADFLGVVLDGPLNAMLDDTVDDNATVLILEHGRERPPRSAGFIEAPKEHRAALVASGMALLHTLASRDPVLVVDTGDTFVMVVTSPKLLGAYLSKRWRQPIPAEPPPTKAGGRWAFSVTPKLGLCRWMVGLSPLPGTPQA